MQKPKQAPAGRWDAQLRHDMAFAQRTLLATGRMFPLAIVHSPETLFAVPLDYSGDEEKLRAHRFLAVLMLAHDAMAFSHITEAWVRHGARRHGESEAAFDERATAVRPSEAEDRIEVVIATLTYRDADGERRTLSDIREIERRANGKPSGLKPLPDMAGEIGGTIPELLPPVLLKPEDKTIAREVLARLAKIYGRRMEVIGRPIDLRDIPAGHA